MTTISSWRVFSLAALALAFCVSAAQAQFRPRGGEDRRSEDRGERRGGERGPGGYGERGDRGPGGYGERGPGERRPGESGRPSEDRGSAPSSSSSYNRAASGSSTIPGFGSTDKNMPQASGFNVPLEVPGGNLEDRYDKRVIERTDRETLPRFDKNKDGFLSAEEAKEGQWDPPFADSDLDKDDRLSRFELYERYAKKMNLPPKTGVVYSSGVSSASPSGSGGSASDTSRVTEYAKGLLNRYDANKSGMLEKDEWRDMKPEHHAADTNKDDVITLEELTAKLAAFATSPSPSSTSSSGSSPSSSPSGGSQRKWWSKEGSGRPGDKEKADGRKSYRVPTATEKLPKGLPDWFARNDTDADGQVLMAEYMTALTETMAAEFARYDLNGDGVITPDEALASAKK